MTVDTQKYLEFVEGVTSEESLHYTALISRMNRLELEDDCNVPQLLTAEEVVFLKEIEILHKQIDSKQTFPPSLVEKLNRL